MGQAPGRGDGDRRDDDHVRTNKMMSTRCERIRVAGSVIGRPRSVDISASDTVIHGKWERESCAVHDHPRVAQQVKRLARLPHHGDEEAAGSEVGLDGADPWRSVGAYGADQNELVHDEALARERGELGAHVLELVPAQRFLPRSRLVTLRAWHPTIRRRRAMVRTRRHEVRSGPCAGRTTDQDPRGVPKAAPAGEWARALSPHGEVAGDDDHDPGDDRRDHPREAQSPSIGPDGADLRRRLQARRAKADALSTEHRSEYLSVLTFRMSDARPSID
jgi:hypothetical protein